MPSFDVVLPPAPPDQPFEVTLRVDADTWLGALKVGLDRICGAAAAERVLAEVHGDDAMTVHDPRSGRSFRVVLSAPAAPLRAVPPPRTPEEREREDALADVFVRAPRALAAHAAAADGLGALLDLARERIACESGLAWTADAAAGALSAAAARGARAADLLRRGSLPFGRGIAGFCAQEGVCLSVADAAGDPRAAGDAAPRRTVLCAPMALGNRVYGVLELANREGGPFGEGDLAVLAYLAHQGALWLRGREQRAP